MPNIIVANKVKDVWQCPICKMRVKAGIESYAEVGTPMCSECNEIMELVEIVEAKKKKK